jgi:nucleoside 2-deoxyribosyltransferase
VEQSDIHERCSGDRLVRYRCDALLGQLFGFGTAWECGYAYATHKPVVVVQLGESSNLMVHEGSHTNVMTIEELKTYDFEMMPRTGFKGKMF